MHQGIAKHLGISWRTRWGLLLFTGDDVEFRNAVVLISRTFSRSIAHALLGTDVNQHGFMVDLARIAQDRHQGVQVVTINHTNIVEAKLFKEGAPLDHTTSIFIRLARGIRERQGPDFNHLFGGFAQG